IVADQLTKLWIQHNLYLGERIKLLPVLNIFHTYNPGAAWSTFASGGPVVRWGLSALAVGVSIFLVSWLRKLPLAGHKVLTFGLTLIVAGALGNCIDRLYLGYVVDFIETHWGPWFFPSFNVADSCITVGAVLVIFTTLREALEERRQ